MNCMKVTFTFKKQKTWAEVTVMWFKKIINPISLIEVNLNSDGKHI